MITINKFRHTDESGRSMIEMLGVLAIVGVLSVGGITGYSKAMQRFKVSKTVDQVQYVVSNIRSMHAGQADYTGLALSTAVAAGLFPNDMVFGAADIRHAFNGAVNVAAVKVGTNTDRGFAITFSGLERGVCAELAQLDFGRTDRGSGFMGVSAYTGASPSADNTFAWGDVNGITVSKDFDDLTPTAAVGSDACSATDGTNAVAWYFI